MLAHWMSIHQLSTVNQSQECVFNYNLQKATSKDL